MANSGGLGAGADEGVVVLSQHLVRTHARLGQVENYDLALSINHSAYDLPHSIESLLISVA